MLNLALTMDEMSAVGGLPLDADLPASGRTIRIRDAGNRNRVKVNYARQDIGSPVACSSALGEANFGGGVGAASLSAVQAIEIAVPTLSPGAIAAFYFYSQLLSGGSKKPIRLVPYSAGFEFAGLRAGIEDQSASVNRQAEIVIWNPTSGSISGGTYYFFAIIGE